MNPPVAAVPMGAFRTLWPTVLGRAKRCALLWSALILGGCAGGVLTSDAEPPETFTLHHAAPAATRLSQATATQATESMASAPLQTLPLVLVVSRPRASATLDTDRIATMPGENRFDYYADARWSETAPEMLQHALVDSLTADGRFDAVLAAPARVPTEMMLDLELRRFESVATGSGSVPVVHVEIQASLVDTRRSVRIASFVSDATARASENRLSAVILAFDAASAEVIDDVVQRVRAASANVAIAPAAGVAAKP
jgi:cholesterol transport system auxiliary component